MVPGPNPKDSMKSTWRSQPRETWNVHQKLIDRLNAHTTNIDEHVPVHVKNDKIPFMPQWPVQTWVMFYAMIPLALHQAYTYFTGYKLGPISTFHLYFMAFNIIIVRQVHILRRLGHKHGFLDGDKHERDGVPDVGAGKVAASLYKTTGSRIAMAVYLAYDPNKPPLAVMSDWKWWGWLSLEIGLYGVVLDFWFYVYHRCMHDISFLWKYHRTHHLTKHPNPLLTAYADHEQEFFDMVGVPFMTYITMYAMGLKLGFYEWFVCHQFIAFTELWGHSGLRIHMMPPSTLNWLLCLIGADLVVEDHDLHHRKGWRKSHNYGKQTRVWDRLFGTTTYRIESVPENIDYSNEARMPIF